MFEAVLYLHLILSLGIGPVCRTPYTILCFYSFHAFLCSFHDLSRAKVYASFSWLSGFLWTAFWHTHRRKPFFVAPHGDIHLRNLLCQENNKYDALCERYCPVLGFLVSQTLNLPLLAIFKHSLLIPPWPKRNSRSGGGPIPSSGGNRVIRNDMSCMWASTNTNSGCESLDEDGNDGSSLMFMYKLVSGLFQLYDTGF